MESPSEVQLERMADAIVWRRLETDPRYKHAANAEEQSAREDEIEAAVWRELRERYPEN